MGKDYLVGRTILKVEIADDKKALRFTCEDGEHIARADGDCCSETWIEDISLPALGLPSMVLSAEDLDMPDPIEADSEHDCLQFYGLKLVTDRGEITIEYRNSSNGYYGGDLAWPGDYYDGGVYGQNVSTEDWRTVAA